MIHDAVKVIGALHTLERETDDSFVAREIQLLKRNDKSNHKLSSINVRAPVRSPNTHSIKFWLDQIKKRKVKFSEFMQKAGSEVLHRMVKRSNRVSPLNDKKYASTFKITWISEGDICFQPQFHNYKQLKIKAPGNFYNLLLTHDPDTFQDDLNCMMIDMNGRNNYILAGV